MKDLKQQTCKTCQHWKSEQAELGYSKFYGICTSYKLEYSTKDGVSCGVLDRDNICKTRTNLQHFESQKNEVPYGVANISRYCFITNEDFGCIHYKK